MCIIWPSVSLNFFSKVDQLQNDPGFLEWAKRKLELDEDSRRNELENERAQGSAFVSAAFQQQPKTVDENMAPNKTAAVPLTNSKGPKQAPVVAATAKRTNLARPGPRALKKLDDDEILAAHQDKGPVPSGKLRVECIMGSYQGREWIVTPMASKSKKDVRIGRSAARACKEHGICLSEDTEVSTRHGTITLEDGKFFYHDASSTNGSYVFPNDTEPVSPHTKVEITKGLKIRVGQQVLLFSF